MQVKNYPNAGKLMIALKQIKLDASRINKKLNKK